jgi:eukaryotic-like serine/threonine-protein kinase
MVPTELANICRRAMQKAPADRYQSAQVFRDALTGYLRHHEAHELHERTMEKLEQLERAGEGQPSLERLFTECRFGFEQVHRAWPDFEPARVALRRALVLMIRHELSRHAPQSARALLSELVQPPAELVLEVENAERAEQERAARLLALEQHAKDVSPEAARDPKSVYVKVIAFLSMSFSLTIQALETTGTVHFTTRDGVVFGLMMFLNSLVYATWLRNQPEANRLQRRISAALIGMSFLSGLGWWLAYQYGVSFHAAVVTFFLISATGWWTAAIVTETRGAIVAVGFALAAVIGMIFPAFVSGGGVTIGVSLWVLARRLRTGP